MVSEIVSRLKWQAVNVQPITVQLRSVELQLSSDVGRTMRGCVCTCRNGEATCATNICSPLLNGEDRQGHEADVRLRLGERACLTVIKPSSHLLANGIRGTVWNASRRKAVV